MNFQSLINTNNLLIKPLTVDDNNFIFQLVNTEGWIRFIGNRNVASPVEAIAYIKKILENENIFYWLVTLKATEEKIGVITFIKRDYLEHHDIGFALLPDFSKNGYAYEAATAVLNTLIKDQKLLYILATTLPENISSIRLLKKIGLAFEKEIEVEKEKLHVYGALTKKLLVPLSVVD